MAKCEIRTEKWEPRPRFSSLISHLSSRISNFAVSGARPPRRDDAPWIVAEDPLDAGIPEHLRDGGIIDRPHVHGQAGRPRVPSYGQRNPSMSGRYGQGGERKPGASAAPPPKERVWEKAEE